MVLFRTVRYSTPAEIIRRQLNRHSVSRQNFYEMHSHFPGYVGQDPVPIIQLHPEHGIR
jgi:hypothetical protein